MSQISSGQSFSAALSSPAAEVSRYYSLYRSGLISYFLLNQEREYMRNSVSSCALEGHSSDTIEHKEVVKGLVSSSLYRNVPSLTMRSLFMNNDDKQYLRHITWGVGIRLFSSQKSRESDLKGVQLRFFRQAVSYILNEILEYVGYAGDSLTHEPNASSHDTHAGRKRPRDICDSTPTHGQSYLTEPIFYIQPPYDNCTVLFVRMISSSVLNDEELNTYFGRYGMLGSRKVGVPTVMSTHPEEGMRDDGNDEESNDNNDGLMEGGNNEDKVRNSQRKVSGATPEIERSVDVPPGHQLVQDFLITVDGTRNTIKAALELRYPDILLIAFSHPDRNKYGICDIPSPASLSHKGNPNCTGTTPRLDALLTCVVAHPPGSLLFAHVTSGIRALHPQAPLALIVEDGRDLPADEGRIAGMSGEVPAEGDEFELIGHRGGQLNRAADWSDSRAMDKHLTGGAAEAPGRVCSDDDEEAYRTYFTAEELDNMKRFVPEVVVDNIPYWISIDKLQQYFTLFGTVVYIKPSTNDKNGSFNGCVLVMMQTVEEAVALAEGVHGKDLVDCVDPELAADGVAGWPLIAGVFDRDFNIVSIAPCTNEDIVLYLANLKDKHKGDGPTKLITAEDRGEVDNGTVLVAAHHPRNDPSYTPAMKAVSLITAPKKPYFVTLLKPSEWNTCNPALAATLVAPDLLSRSTEEVSGERRSIPLLGHNSAASEAQRLASNSSLLVTKGFSEITHHQRMWL